jgi:hypothetical protein
VKTLALFLLCIPLAAQSLPTAPATYLPEYIVSAGGGAVVPGHGGSFAYQCFGAMLGQATYGLSCQQWSVVNGQIQNCALAGLMKPTHQFGPISFGVTGLGGGCESTNGNAAAAGNAQVFVNFHIGKTPLNIPITYEKTFSAVGKQAAQLTGGIIWAWGK